MKMASVVSVQDITPPEHEQDHGGSVARKRIAELLRRYPAVKESENSEILRYLATGPHLDVGLLGADDELRPKVAAFRKAHAQHFRLKASEAALFLIATLGPAALFMVQYLIR